MRRLVIWLVCGVLGLALTASCGGGEEGVPIFFQSDRDGNWEIYSIRHTGRLLTRLTNDPAADTSPEVSYEGNKVAFVRSQGEVTDIWTMNVDGSNQRNVTNGNAKGAISSVAWFPRGAELIFAMAAPDVAEGRSQLYRIREDGSNLSRITKQDDMFYITPRVHPLGGQIIAAAGASEDSFDIHILEFDGDPVRTVPNETFRAAERNFDQEDVNEIHPDFDSTGRFIIFQTDLVGGRWQVFRVEGDGRKPTNLTPIDATWSETQPSWTGALDRAWFAFVSDKDGNEEIYIANTGTREAKRLTDSPAKDQHPTWVKTPSAR